MALPAPTPSTIMTSSTGRGAGTHHEGHPEREHQLFDRQHDEEALAVDLVGQEAADMGRTRVGPDWAKMMTPTNVPNA